MALAGTGGGAALSSGAVCDVGILAIRQRQVEVHWNCVGVSVLAIAQYAIGLSVCLYLKKADLLLWGANLISGDGILPYGGAE